MGKIFIVSVLMSLSMGAFAQYESTVETSYESGKVESRSAAKWNMGLTSGINSPQGDIGSAPEFGLYVGAHPAAQMQVGLETMSSRLNDPGKMQRTRVLAEAAYTFGTYSSNIYNFYVGVGGGPVFSNLPTEWTLAPMVGFDFPLVSKANDFVSLGANAKYLLNTNAPEAITSALAVKYWF